MRGAAGGNETLREIYEEARAALTDRIFTRGRRRATIIPDTPAARLMVRGWSAMTEELVLSWVADPRGVTREQLLAVLAASLPALVDAPPLSASSVRRVARPRPCRRAAAA